jgi:serine/threonine protein phosphatase 1
MSALRRAAYTDDSGLLFVHAGLDPARPLADQGDALWWGHTGWSRITAPYEGYRCVVRGIGRPASVAAATPYAMTVDGGCGFGGTLVAACFAPSGEPLERIEA